ncbi:MAG: hypothetical protein H0W71_01960 [Sphingomonas sp.]|nr:hypothetical protein [Sphingomonas sp.]
MSPNDIGRVFALAEDSFERASAISVKTDRSIARTDDVLARSASRDGVARAAAQRERRRLNAGLGRTTKRVGLAILAVWIATMVVGFVNPIGLFGLILAIAAGVILVGLAVASSRRSSAPALPAPDLPSAVLVERLDSYLYRARAMLPAPAQSEVDLMLAALPNLKPTLERIDPLEPAAQDARRLMGKHLPNLIDHYLAVPAGYRGDHDNDGISVDQRLVDALRAGREALDETGERLAKGDLAAFETQGRFIESRYGEQPLDN